ncbi:metalloregulator ArsR/SmtB family transcription factor [Marisediminicola senii]|uniref:metalloregulator ArsR/SmtB family transcription factor n=1 Tax=Marisediminicola senii TaxID=2711233 RepID=UPI0013EE24D4|nr:metalloregulator ArsR/SmtB family transcription factor [Marisediminicola senii]
MSGTTLPDDLRLLADPTRARIVNLILQSTGGRMLVGALTAELGLRQPTVSHHLKVLHEGGFLDRHPVGRTVGYSVSPARISRVQDLLQDSPGGEMTPGVLERISADLADRFAGTFSPETVDRYVRESHALLADRARVTRYLPSLTSRFAADRLEALASSETAASSETEASAHVPEVLFVCVQNAGRSQLAAGILRHLGGDRVRVRSAGSAPADTVRGVIVGALDEIGVAVGGEFPKPLTDEVVRAADVVVTMGCGDACPVYPGKRYLDWELDDPVGLPLDRVREIRDQIDARVRELLASIT